MNLIDQIEAGELKKKAPQIRIGDTVRAHIRIVEGEKERVQVFEGIAIRLHGGGVRETVTLRKVSFGVGVERILPLHSPRLEKTEVIRRAKIRQAKLYYLIAKTSFIFFNLIEFRFKIFKCFSIF